MLATVISSSQPVIKPYSYMAKNAIYEPALLQAVAALFCPIAR